MINPLVSIGMPVYNAEKTIESALRSLLAQDYENIEIVICDNASDDLTRQICAEYMQKDSRIKYFCNDVNKGAAYSFHRVVELASGEYFMWAGCHDLWTPDYISRLLELLSSNLSITLAYTETFRIDASGNVLNVEPYHFDTQGLSRVDRVQRIVRGIEACDMFYGIYRISDLKKCRLKFDYLGADHVLLLEVGILGQIVEVPKKGFLRREPIRDDDEAKRVATLLLRMNPAFVKRKNIRRWWELGLQHLISIWLMPLRVVEKCHLIFVTGKTYYLRFRRRLLHELFNPLFPNGVSEVSEIPKW